MWLLLPVFDCLRKFYFNKSVESTFVLCVNSWLYSSSITHVSREVSVPWRLCRNYLRQVAIWTTLLKYTRHLTKWSVYVNEFRYSSWRVSLFSHISVQLRHETLELLGVYATSSASNRLAFPYCRFLVCSLRLIRWMTPYYIYRFLVSCPWRIIFRLPWLVFGKRIRTKFIELWLKK